MGEALKRRIYAIIWKPRWWTILVCILQGRFSRLEKVLDYLDRRLNREIYQQQLVGWALDRKRKELGEKLARVQALLNGVEL